MFTVKLPIHMEQSKISIDVFVNHIVYITEVETDSTSIQEHQYEYKSLINTYIVHLSNDHRYIVDNSIYNREQLMKDINETLIYPHSLTNKNNTWL